MFGKVEFFFKRTNTLVPLLFFFACYNNKMVTEYNPLRNESNDLNPLLRDDQQPLLTSTTSIPRGSTSFSRASLSTLIEPTTIFVQDYEQQYATATPVSCIINLANTILGTGMLAMVIKKKKKRERE